MLQFASHSHRLRVSKSFALPLIVGCAVAQKTRLPGDDGLRCQDAVTLDLLDDALIGVVCDGCGGVRCDDPETRRDSSANEVAAILFSEMIASQIVALHTRSPLSTLTPDEIHKELNTILELLLAKLGSLTSDEQDSLGFVERFLLTTVQVLICTPGIVLIVGHGDGAIEVNGQSTSFWSDEGSYVSSVLLPENQKSRVLEIRLNAEMSTIKTLVVGTDGWETLARDYKVGSLADALSASEQSSPGFDLAFPQRLRGAITTSPQRLRLRDDVALICLERVKDS